MREKYCSEITEFIYNLDESQLLYILTLIKKLFGGH